MAGPAEMKFDSSVASVNSLAETDVHRVVGGSTALSTDILAVEEPLEIRLGTSQNGKSTHKALSITMRTPGEDAALAAGFLFTEGIVSNSADIAEIRHCGRSADGRDLQNTIVVELASGVEVDAKRIERNFYTTSSCGVCGKSSIEALRTGVKPLAGVPAAIEPAFLRGLPAKLAAAQAGFAKTGGLHASILFDRNGTMTAIAEDVGRHNALDKVIGTAFLEDNLPLSETVLLVSGRASFELVQKALMAGIPVLAAIGAPSSLAVELAAEYGMTLVGFLSDTRFNIYSGPHRISS
jgi:FdhD protein